MNDAGGQLDSEAPVNRATSSAREPTAACFRSTDFRPLMCHLPVRGHATLILDVPVPDIPQVTLAQRGLTPSYQGPQIPPSDTCALWLYMLASALSLGHATARQCSESATLSGTPLRA